MWPSELYRDSVLVHSRSNDGLVVFIGDFAREHLEVVVHIGSIPYLKAGKTDHSNGEMWLFHWGRYSEVEVDELSVLVAFNDDSELAWEESVGQVVIETPNKTLSNPHCVVGIIRCVFDD